MTNTIQGPFDVEGGFFVYVESPRRRSARACGIVKRHYPHIQSYSLLFALVGLIFFFFHLVHIFRIFYI